MNVARADAGPVEHGKAALMTRALRPRYPHFDGLRAVAASSVIAFHVLFVTRGQGDASYIERLENLLSAGVTVFFVISGFLLYLPFVQADLDGRDVSLKRYAGKRVRRIVPGYWAVLLILSVTPLAGNVLVFGGWRYFLFVQTYHSATLFGGLSAAWTLCVEVVFYLLLPVYALVLRRLGGSRRSRRVRAETAALVGLLLLWLAAKVDVLPRIGNGATVVATTFPLLVVWFLPGMALAVLAAAGSGRIERAVRRWPWPLWGAGVGLLAVAAELSPAGLTFLPAHGAIVMLLLAGAAAALVAPLVFPSATATPVHRSLISRPVAWAGVVSFGLYLWNLPLLKAFHDAGAPTWLTAVGGTAATVAAAAGSWYLIEQPATRSTRSKALVPGQVS